MRPTINEYFKKLMLDVSERATCNKKKVGCIIAKDNRILTTGYNGSPSRMPHCEDVGCLLDDNSKCIRCIHAEQNAICQAAKYGININESDLYCTIMPCYTCAKLIVQCGIRNIYILKDDKKDPLIKNLFFMSGINVNIYDY